MLVLDDADLDRAVEGALWGSFTNCGQICSGIERIYVEAPLYEPFVERLAERAASLRIGHGDELTIELGPLITEGQRARVEALVADAVEHGAEVVTGGGRPATGLPGWFHEPTVLAGEPASSRIRREELFGPRRHRCQDRQRGGRHPPGQRLTVRSRRQRLDAGSASAGDALPPGSRPAPSG